MVTVDFLGARRVEIGADGNQRAVAHVDVAVRNVAELGVHRDQIGAAHNEFAALRQLAGGSRRSTRTIRGTSRAPGKPQRARSGHGLDEISSTQGVFFGHGCLLENAPCEALRFAERH